MNLLLFFAIIQSVSCRPKTAEVGVLLNDLPSGRPRIEQPYLRHGVLTSESRRSEGLDFCRRTAKCLPMKNSTIPTNDCLTTKLPYSQTSLELVTDSITQDDVQVFPIFQSYLKLLKLIFCDFLGEADVLAEFEECAEVLGSDPTLPMCPLHAKV